MIGWEETDCGIHKSKRCRKRWEGVRNKESRREGSRRRLRKCRCGESNRQDIHPVLDSIKGNVGKA